MKKRHRKQTAEHVDRRREALKSYWRKRKELYGKIALKNTPSSVLCIQIMDRKNKEYDGKAFANRGLLIVPRPTTLKKLWIFLHECYHAGNFQPFNKIHWEEYQAEEFALKSIEAAGISAPFWLIFESRWYVRALIMKDEANGFFIAPDAAKYASYQPKPYVLDQDGMLKQIAEQTEELLKAPRLSEAEVRRIAAIRKEYSKTKAD
jgi:hypothetical protein